jgi:hypothetical protein
MISFIDNKNTFLVFLIIFILILNIPSTGANIDELENDFKNNICEDLNIKSIGNSLDVQFIYNITAKLSNIIFDEYDEENGEIAKGRAYGTKGEHKAAEILYENMTKLGLYTKKEQIENTDQYPDLTHELEIKDYFVKINNRKIDSYIAPVWIENSENNYNVNHIYNYSNLKIIEPPIIPGLYIKWQRFLGKLEPFVVIIKDKAFYPYSPLKKLPFTDNFIFDYYVIRQLQGGVPVLYSYLWDNYLDYCKGVILYDFNKEVHDMNLLKKFNHVPFIYINGSDGEQILNNIEDSRIDFRLKQQMNTSVISYNVIGQLNGSDESCTVIVDCLYDSWWCQGTADSAIGMAMVLAIAKYYTENNLTPKYTMKFIGFSGEEHGFNAGSKYYESSHKDENIKYVIDLNQLGFKQEDPKLSLNIIGNRIGFLNRIIKLTKEIDYNSRVNCSDGVKYLYLKNGGPGNALIFAKNRDDCKTVCFLKDGRWKMHHRDGLNHTEGDVLKYFDWTDVNVTGEIVLSVTKYLTLDEFRNTEKKGEHIR